MAIGGTMKQPVLITSNALSNSQLKELQAWWSINRPNYSGIVRKITIPLGFRHIDFELREIEIN